ncbi:hypothetical protein BDA99DRAFT_18122 [Phascolomyces articulosus]|uniref:F-box domain-containing protein n=1 Tax=Phascolomyces articulosus TaxID=60185 RepID=A0AAD5L0M3_9FUNG|nr:hypothetical protein BDA99DRAFT_18122 [Phascolomyces articulosus]
MVTAVWDELSKTTTTATNALGNNSLSQAIEQSTTAIQLLRNQFVTLLEIRATAWAKAGNSSKELEDALTMVDIAPHCSTGYLRSSTLYANLGYQKSAVEILEKGVDNVPHHDPQYISLVQNAMIAQMQLRRRVDFITTCPPEIVCIILDKVSMDDLYDCICVSTTWRKIIVHHPYRWKTFKISDFKSNSVELLLPVVSPYIEELHVWGSQTFIGKQLTVIQTNQFSRLRSLNINHEPYTSQSSILVFLYMKESSIPFQKSEIS